MVLDLCQATDDADQNRVVGNTKLVAKLCASRSVIGEETEIESQRNHFDLPRSSDAKLLADLNALLFTDNNQPIGNELRQESFDREK